ncbi:hypothetical protein Q0601_09115 [Paracoccus onubensis]|uniref:hypothetical protein n=1 Tax=Paracoccus onubensis TaxID=1675788 RepID=UPI0027303425|nr:hypothetical protein [Paracoccus onubensis]MDP0927327.1 hypothetical protein [Paracoccus onubensis]
MKGGVNRFFIVVAGVMEVHAWLESEEEDWYDLIARLGLVLLAAVLTAIIAVFLVGIFSFTGVVFSIVVAGVSLVVGFVVTFVFALLKIRQALAGLLRFAGRMIIEAYRSFIGYIYNIWQGEAAMDSA